jgi:hypothetical protein
MTTDASALPLDLQEEAVWDLETRFWHGDDAAYAAWASSAYTRSDGVWSLGLHQQTPIA